MSNGIDKASSQQDRGKAKLYAVSGVVGIFLVACIIGVAVHSTGGSDEDSNQGGGTSQVLIPDIQKCN